jgi:hypothetical protein
LSAHPDPAFVPAVVPLLADDEVGAHAAGYVGDAAADPAGVYLEALARGKIGVRGRGWMWRGWERSAPESRVRLLPDYATMLRDESPMNEYDGAARRSRTLADRAFEELARWSGYDRWRPVDLAERALVVQAWETWWQRCQHPGR